MRELTGSGTRRVLSVDDHQTPERHGRLIGHSEQGENVSVQTDTFRLGVELDYYGIDPQTGAKSTGFLRVRVKKSASVTGRRGAGM